MKVREPKGQKPQLDRERAAKTHTDHNTPPTRRGTELHKLENGLFFSSGIYRCFVVGVSEYISVHHSELYSGLHSGVSFSSRT